MRLLAQLTHETGAARPANVPDVIRRLEIRVDGATMNSFQHGLRHPVDLPAAVDIGRHLDPPKLMAFDAG
ncbi:MAG TPA: hypothetical protein PKE47_15990, partial [Verrucomicrobiota bacterium]|nr:hypothetical protein [Verrucomicrobiota bacterium]